MFDIDVKFSDICIKSIQEKDIHNLKKWFISQHMDLKYYINFNDLYERFLEYYMSECEFFLEINKKGNLSGILKGRIEFKSKNMVWISCFCVNEDLINEEEQKSILENMMNYFCMSFGVSCFLTGVAQSEKNTIKILNEINFKVVRVNKEFYTNYKHKEDLLILQKIN
ncbi:GNAT family N-acetyltransferase [Clostridium guangxiense]|uniref:GNAT family N-acetyltransferase n=1 Tax=Clostridium guangxiense TaxID=1662055 RepID=UPI001E59B863|nr:GNAT family N-acetyltransferase [Clostridium guangxiense]MCD2346217.1 GNAT family N-acetyltransferase [Clostridium guangxiense]